MKVFGRTWHLAVGAFFAAKGIASAEYRFDVWTADSGLPHNAVRAIVQCHDGHLWVGTAEWGKQAQFQEFASKKLFDSGSDLG